MAKLKRKAINSKNDGHDPPPKRVRSGKDSATTAAATRPRRASARNTDVPIVNNSTAKRPGHVKKLDKASRASSSKPSVRIASSQRSSSVSVEMEINRHEESEKKEKPFGDENDTISYWLMKAEPESRIEKGKDVKFSIDDLAKALKPEGWDGVRNLAARNNMRAMRKGDMAFFYYSNCKTPGIAGTMEIVQEHSVDESAFDPNHPYYDPKSHRDDPKWSLVHVEFRRKFPNLVKLKDLQRFATAGGVLENLQTLRQSRLSVSKVIKNEWNFILSLVDNGEGSAEALHDAT